MILLKRAKKSSATPAAGIKKHWAWWVPAVILLAGCAQGNNLPMLAEPTPQSYLLGPGDQIRVITYDESQLSNDFTVGADGMIAFPLLGTITASGHTVDELADAIDNSLTKKQIISQPSVSVQVITYRPISVLGEVNHPGQYPYQPGMTMLDAVALAGGFTYRAVTNYAGDWRNQGPDAGLAVQGKISPGSGLEPGDVVTVYQRYF